MQVLSESSVTVLAAGSELLVRLLPLTIGVIMSRGRELKAGLKHLADELLDALLQAPKTTTFCGVGLFLALVAHPCGTYFYAWATRGGANDLQAGAALIIPAVGTLILATFSVALHQSALRIWSELNAKPTAVEPVTPNACVPLCLDGDTDDGDGPTKYEAPLRFFLAWGLAVFLVWGVLFLLRQVAI